MSQRIYVGNLPYTATDGELRQLFGEYGEVESVHLVSDRDAAHCHAETRTHSRIIDVGDADLLSTADDVAAQDTLAVPAFVATRSSAYTASPT